MQARDDAYVLSRRAFRENSLLLQIFSRQHGRISCIAHVAKKRGRILKSSLEPFRLLDISWRGHGDVQTLIRAEERGRHPIPRHALCYSLYLNELSLRLLYPQQSAEALFKHYQQTLHHLSQISHKASVTSVSRSSFSAIAQKSDRHNFFTLIVSYELQLLRLLGYELNLTHDDYTGHTIQADETYYFSFETGVSHLALTQNSIPVSGQTLLALTRLDYSAAKPIRRFINALLDQLLLGKKLNSRLLINF